jgi:hypothetical protein
VEKVEGMVFEERKWLRSHCVVVVSFLIFWFICGVFIVD